MDNKKNQDIDKRAARRKRRRRSQVISFSVVFAVALAFLAVLIIGVSHLIGWVKNGKEEAEQRIQEQIEEMKEQQSSSLMFEIDEDDAEEAESEEESPLEVIDDEEALEELVEGFIQEMTLEEKAASVFLVSPESITGVDAVVKAGDGTKTALEKYCVGGLVYQSKNIKDADQIMQMIKNTSSYSKYPLFFAVSEESGQGILMENSELGAEQTENAEALANAGDMDKVSETYDIIGDYLSTLGFNMNFAPVADVLTNEKNEELKGRTFGSDVELASKMVVASVAALQEKNVSAVLMTFPGEGDIDTSEDGVSVTNKSLSELKSTELVTFKAAIKAGADCVMVSHICAPTITDDTTPCSMSSKMIKEVLRDDLKFHGVVITEAMNQKAITEQYSSAEAAVKALKAGADMILYPENFEEAYQGVLDALESGELKEERLNEAIHRIFMLKYKNSL